MRCSILSAAMALASLVLAQTPGFDAISSPTLDQTVAVGSTLQIVWEPAKITGPVTITLLQGSSPSTLQLGPVVKASIDNTLGKFAWTVPTTVGSFATYGFSITLDADPKTFQYSFPFHITGASASGPSAGHPSSSRPAEGYATYATSAHSTKTVQLSTGPAYNQYTASPLSSTIVASYSTKAANATSSQPPKPTHAASNGTLSTTAKPVPSTTAGSATSAANGGTPSQTPNAAPGHMVTGGFAFLGGLALALAL